MLDDEVKAIKDYFKSYAMYNKKYFKRQRCITNILMMSFLTSVILLIIGIIDEMTGMLNNKQSDEKIKCVFYGISIAILAVIFICIFIANLRRKKERKTVNYEKIDDISLFLNKDTVHNLADEKTLILQSDNVTAIIYSGSIDEEDKYKEQLSNVYNWICNLPIQSSNPIDKISETIDYFEQYKDESEYKSGIELFESIGNYLIPPFTIISVRFLLALITEAYDAVQTQNITESIIEILIFLSYFTIMAIIELGKLAWHINSKQFERNSAANLIMKYLVTLKYFDGDLSKIDDIET